MCAASALIFSDPARGALAPVVRVMVEKSPSTVIIEGFDLEVHDALTNLSVAQGDGRSKLSFRCLLGGKVRVNSAQSSGKVANNRPVQGPLKVTSLGGFIRVDERRYRDDLYLYSQNGQCMVVNHVDLEKYIAGLLNSEMSSSWNLETLKAQAVAARTYALFQMREASSLTVSSRQFFDLESTVKDQVYDGAHQERFRAMKAVEATRGEVLTFNSKPIKAFYHSTCGGHTESPEKVWGTRLPYIKPVPCGYCHTSPRFRWKHELTLAEATHIMRAHGIIRFFLGGLRVISRNAAGRALEIEVVDGNQPRRIRSTALREVLGYGKLRSTNFEVLQNGGRITFAGSGSGHGVGLCQWGAKTMGEKGIPYTQILRRYYPLAQLSRLY